MRALFLVLLAACGAAHAADEASFVNEGVIPAPVDEVWKVFSTSDGYKTLGPRSRRSTCASAASFARAIAPMACSATPRRSRTPSSSTARRS